MSIDLQVKIGIDGADKPGAVASELDKMTAAEERAKEGAKRLTAEVSELAEMFGIEMAAGAAVGQATDKMAGFTLKQLKILEQINAPAKEWADQLKAIKGLLDAGALSSDQYVQQLTKLQRATGETNSVEAQAAIALERQAAALDRIHGPMLRYEQDLAALDALYKQDKISALEFEAELDRLNKKAGVSYGPNAALAAPSKAAPQAAGGSGDGSDLLTKATLDNATMVAGTVLAGGAVIGLGQQIEGLIHNYRDLQDVAITAANAVQRFTDADHTLTIEQDRQIALSHELHATYSQTIGLYGRLAESADALSLSQNEITSLTKEFGEAVQLVGKPIDAADGIMRRFAYGLAAGKIETRELRTIMREVAPIADIWTKSFGATRDELMKMVKDGRVSTEDLMRSLFSGTAMIEDKFKSLQITHKQTADQWLEEDKILSQRYDVANLGGHSAQAAVDAFKANDELRKLYASMSSSGLAGQNADLAREADKQLADDRKAAIAETIDDVKNLTGFMRPLGDRYREWTGDTAAVRAEVLKLNEPMEAARTELVTLTKAFEVGKIDVVEYTKRWGELQTTLGHGVGSQTLKITEPIRLAKLELARFMNEIEAGANVTQAEARKAMAGYETAIHGGVVPEDLKLNNPKLDAGDAIKDLIAKQKEGKITGESFRKEYDALITTVSDGRLPAEIKVWESFTLPLRDWRDEFHALTAIYEEGRIGLLKYTDEAQRAAAAGAKYTQEQFERTAMTIELQKRLQAQTRSALGGTVLVTHDAREAYDRAQAERHRRDEEQRQAGQTGFAPSATSFDSVRASIDAIRPGADASQEWKNINDQIERAHGLMLEFEAPAVTLETALRDIDVAAHAYGLTQQQVNALQTRAKDAYFQQSEALRVVKGPLAEYEATLRKLGHQADDNAISQQKYTDSVRAARIAFLEASGAAKEFGGAMEIEWIKLQQDADAFGASVAHLVVEDFGKLNDALVTAANGGEVAWGKMADSMIQDLERLALKMLEIKLIQSGIGLFGGAIGGGGGGGVAAADEMASAMGYANGGSFVVGGDGGTDTTPVAFRATRGETVTITPPGAYPSASGGYDGGTAAPAAAGRAPSVHIHNHYDSSVGLATIDSRQGNQTVLNVLRANQGTVRSYSGTRR